MACAAEEGVDRITRHAFEEVPPEKAITLHVADLGLDGSPPPQVAFEGVAELARAADEDLASAWIHAVALVPLVHEGGARQLACEPFHLVELSLQRVPIEGVAGAGLDAHAETLLVGDRQAHLHAKLIGAMGLPLSDALHL